MGERPTVAAVLLGSAEVPAAIVETPVRGVSLLGGHAGEPNSVETALTQQAVQAALNPRDDRDAGMRPRGASMQVAGILRNIGRPREQIYRAMNDALPGLGLPILEAQIADLILVKKNKAQQIPVVAMKPDDAASCGVVGVPGRGC